MKTLRLECGCKCTETAWTEQCLRHAAETKELHERAQREYKATKEVRAARADPLAQ